MDLLANVDEDSEADCAKKVLVSRRYLKSIFIVTAQFAKITSARSSFSCEAGNYMGIKSTDNTEV